MTQQPGFPQYDQQYDQPQYGYQQGGYQQYGSQAPVAAPEDRTPAALAHASSLIAMVISAGWLSFVGPLIMWVLYKDRSPFVRQAAAGSFNFNLGLWVMSIVGWICIITVIGIPVGLVLLAVSFVAQVVGHIIGTMRATKGRSIRYPFQIKILN